MTKIHQKKLNNDGQESDTVRKTRNIVIRQFNENNPLSYQRRTSPRNNKLKSTNFNSGQINFNNTHKRQLQYDPNDPQQQATKEIVTPQFYRNNKQNKSFSQSRGSDDDEVYNEINRKIMAVVREKRKQLMTLLNKMNMLIIQEMIIPEVLKV